MDITKEVGWYARIYYELADLKKEVEEYFSRSYNVSTDPTKVALADLVVLPEIVEPFFQEKKNKHVLVVPTTFFLTKDFDQIKKLIDLQTNDIS
ncbi:hypothetical protein CUZ96_2243 [Enterococcus lactis]|nr:hypothetical protein [Enterococcus faecium]MBL5012576.1 hypothetical protein [Enterococcus lactis]